MSKTFSVPFSGDIAPLLKRAQTEASRAGAQLQGDTSRGNFGGRGIEGNYQVEGNTVHITITKKPMLIPDALIEAQLRSFFK